MPGEMTNQELLDLWDADVVAEPIEPPLARTWATDQRIVREAK